MAMPSTRNMTIVSIFLLIFFLIPGINHGLWKPDKPRVAGTCAEMARTHDYVVPHLNGKPFLEKPPLYYAAASLSGTLFGIDTDMSYRLVSLLFAILAILATYGAASRKGGAALGILAGGVLATSWEFFMLSRWIQVDMALVFGTALAMYAYLRVSESPKLFYSAILGLSVGISFLAKGLVGPAVIASAILLDIVLKKNPAMLVKIRPHIVLACAFVVILPWVYGLWLKGGLPFLREAFVVNNLMRFTGAPEGAALGHQHGFFYYVERFPKAILPWSLIFIPAMIASVKKYKDDPYLSWFVGPFVILFMASTKRGLYLVPLFPAMACIIAGWFQEADRARWEDRLVKATKVVLVAGCFAPFAGIFFGRPALSLAMGILALFGMIFFSRARTGEAASIVGIACMALCTITVVYYSAMKPDRDYLSFSRQALSRAGTGDVTIITQDEALQGVLPMVTGRTFKVVESPLNVMDKGVYIWADRDDTVLHALEAVSKVHVLFAKNMDFRGKKTARIAYLVPAAHPSRTRVANVVTSAPEQGSAAEVSAVCGIILSGAAERTRFE